MKTIFIQVIGKDPDKPGELKDIDYIDRVPGSGGIRVVRYKGKMYPVMGGGGSERIFVGID